MAPRPWRLLLDPPGSAAHNMSVDEALLLCAPGAAPTLRLYSWRQPSISLGYRQLPPRWISRCAALGVDAVRRVSGGGTVLHAGDLTYAVVAPRGARSQAQDLPDELAGSYEWIRETLLCGLRRAGLPVRPGRPSGDASRLELCFAGATGFEVELDGYKLVGSAQRRTAWGFLQHGSIRLRDDSALYEALVGHAPGPKPPPLAVCDSDVQQALIEAFADRLDGALERGSLGRSELARVRQRERQRRQQRLFAPALALSRTARSADRFP